VTESEVLIRIDRHLERAEQQGEELRRFIPDITTRQERVTQQLVEEIAANTRRVDAGTEELRDLTLANRRHTQALARILDRLG
jgi:hypothetical protein